MPPPPLRSGAVASSAVVLALLRAAASTAHAAIPEADPINKYLETVFYRRQQNGTEHRNQELSLELIGVNVKQEPHTP